MSTTQPHLPAATAPTTSTTSTATRARRTRRAGRLATLVPALCVVGLAAGCTGAGVTATAPGPKAPGTVDAANAASGVSGTTASEMSGVTGSTVDEFLTFVLTDVDTFWTEAYANSDLGQPYVSYWWAQPGEQLQTGCTDNQGNASVTNDMTAEYCPVDDRIVISTAVASNLWAGTDVFGRGGDARMGDFALAYVVAHEYAHNVQNEMGYDTFAQENGLTVMNLELHADCYAGVWANSAYYEGQLEAGDIEEALAAAEMLGGEDATDPGFHGTSEQRVEAFSLGYNTGDAQQCNDSYLGA